MRFCCFHRGQDHSHTELLPTIKELYEKKYVDASINGNYEKVEKLLKVSANPYYKSKNENIVELYEHIVDTWPGYSKEEEEDFEEDEILKPPVSVKIGRNDPCPCGSGKKIKKCCINKLPL